MSWLSEFLSDLFASLLLRACPSCHGVGEHLPPFCAQQMYEWQQRLEQSKWYIDQMRDWDKPSLYNIFGVTEGRFGPGDPPDVVRSTGERG